MSQHILGLERTVSPSSSKQTVVVLTQYEASITPSPPSYFSGGINRSSPFGGRAYGIPRYSDTPGRTSDAWPFTKPLDVRTVSPTSGLLASTPARSAPRARGNAIRLLIVR